MGVEIGVVVVIVLEDCHHLVMLYNRLSHRFDAAIFVDDDDACSGADDDDACSGGVRQLRTLSSFSVKISLALTRLIVWRVVLP